jgi:hypothetical protein
MRFSAPNGFEKNDWDEMEGTLSLEDQQFWNLIVERIERVLFLPGRGRFPLAGSACR